METYDIGYSSSEYSNNQFFEDDITCSICGIYCPGDTDDTCMIYEQQKEYYAMKYHQMKNSGYWELVINIVQDSYKKSYNNIFLIDVLMEYLDSNNINFYLISEVEYHFSGDTYLIPQFESQFLLENVKINSKKEPSFRFENNISSGSYSLQIY